MSGLCYDISMRYLGIDYGAKRIGLAISDESGVLAFPYVILENTKNKILEIKKTCEKEAVGFIVVGESLDYKGQPNAIKKEIDTFVVALKEAMEMPVAEEREFLTTQQARFYQTTRKRVDDSAAAIILQSYLDRKNNKPMLESLE